MKRKILLYGLLCGASLTLYISMLDASRLIYESSRGAWLGYLAILILPLAVFFALRELREKHQLVLRHSMFVSLCIALTAAGIYSAYTFVDIHFFDAMHLRNLFAFTESEMQKAGASSEEIAARISRMKQHYFSGRPYLNTFLWYGVMGLIYGPLFHFILKFKRSNKTT